MEEAGRRWDAERGNPSQLPISVRSRMLRTLPYASERDAPPDYAQDRRGAYIGGTGIAVGHDTNPNDYEVGIYNPKQ